MRRALFLLAALVPAVAYADPISIGSWVAMSFLAAAPSAGLIAAGVVGWVAAGLTTIAISAGLAKISASLAPTPKGLRTIVTEYGGTVEPRRMIYGTVRVSGMNVIPPVVSGAEGDYLHQVLAIAGHEVNDITSVYFNQEQILDANITAITGSANDGLVTSGTYEDVAWIRRYDGSQTTVDYILNDALYTNWESTDKGQGVAYLAIQYKYKKNPYQKEGKPEVSCIVEGKKVYDPRLDSTNGGAGTHRYDDDSTWEYSNNPALCLADYLMDSALGMGEDPSRIDWTSVAVAANECDEVVTVPSGGSPEGTSQYRYRCNIVLVATDRYEDNIEAICDTMMGHCYYSSGKWQVHAGGWTASAFDLDQNDIVGSVSIRTETPRSDKYNAVRGQYYDAQRQYQPSEFKPRTNSTYETQDGERIWREIQLRGCTNEYEAQRIAIIMNRRGRNSVSVTADFSMAAFKVKPFETGTLTLPEVGWNEQPVRCASWEFRPEGTVRLTLTEESSTDWDDPEVSEYTYVAGASAPPLAGYTPPSATSLTATPVTNGVLLEWEISELPNGCYFEVFREGDSSLSSPATPSLLSTTYGASYLDPTTGTNTYYYWVRAVSPSGTPGPMYPTGAGVSGTGSGVTGAGGESVKIIFKRSATQPTTPTPSVGTPATWYADVGSVPDTSPYTPLWASTGTRIEASPENNWTWQTPVKFEGVDGADGTGTDGNTQIMLNIFRRASSAPSTPTGGSYTFQTRNFTPPTNWFAYVPSGTDPCYISTGIAAITGTTGTDSSITWSSPTIAFQNGEDGTTPSVFWVTASNAFGSNSGGSPSGTVTSGAVTVTPNNGTPTYTYYWKHLTTEEGNTPTISSETSASPTFSATVITEVDAISYWQVFVTDSASPQNVATDVIRVRLTYLQV